MARAKHIASWSKDPDHKVGAVIVDSRNHQISEGYNGPPRDVRDDIADKDTRRMRSLHAEFNAILDANESLENATIFIYPYAPCAQCAAAIIQKKIGTVVYHVESDLKTWRASQEEALRMLEEAGIYYYRLKSRFSTT
jgi:dCMP deaminase